MILTDELCDRLCAAAHEKAKKSESTSALPSVMKTACPEHTGVMGRHWCRRRNRRTGLRGCGVCRFCIP